MTFENWWEYVTILFLCCINNSHTNTKIKIKMNKIDHKKLFLFVLPNENKNPKNVINNEK